MKELTSWQRTEINILECKSSAKVICICLLIYLLTDNKGGIYVAITMGVPERSGAVTKAMLWIEFNKLWDKTIWKQWAWPSIIGKYNVFISFNGVNSSQWCWGFNAIILFLSVFTCSRKANPLHPPVRHESTVVWGEAEGWGWLEETGEMPRTPFAPWWTSWCHYGVSWILERRAGDRRGGETKTGSRKQRVLERHLERGGEGKSWTNRELNFFSSFLLPPFFAWKDPQEKKSE